jgi:RHS repeat-associated protein
MYLPEKLVTSVSTDSKQREVGYLGKQIFELSNHLGNILATITDKKLQVSTNTTSTDYFEADVQTVQDYYAFGMQMPGRKLSGGYRYGFNGKENDNEVKGEGSSQDYGMRIYDGKIGKFLSVDPLTKAYPELTPYQFAENTPIQAIDLDGLEKYMVINYYNNQNALRKVVIGAIQANDSKQIVDLMFKTANGGDLTNKDVYIRNLYFDGRQKAEPVEKDMLSKDQQKIFDAAKSVDPLKRFPGSETFGYDFKDQIGGEGTISEAFDAKNFHFKEGEKQIPILKKLDYNLRDGIFAYLGTSDNLGGGLKNGTLDLSLPGGHHITELLKNIKEDGDINSARITISYSLFNTDNAGYNAFRRGIEYTGQQYKKLFEKAGVKNVTVNTNVLRDPVQRVGGIDIKLKR